MFLGRSCTTRLKRPGFRDGPEAFFCLSNSNRSSPKPLQWKKKSFRWPQFSSRSFRKLFMLAGAVLIYFLLQMRRFLFCHWITALVFLKGWTCHSLWSDEVIRNCKSYTPHLPWKDLNITKNTLPKAYSCLCPDSSNCAFATLDWLWYQVILPGQVQHTRRKQCCFNWFPRQWQIMFISNKNPASVFPVTWFPPASGLPLEKSKMQLESGPCRGMRIQTIQFTLECQPGSPQWPLLKNQTYGPCSRPCCPWVRTLQQHPECCWPTHSC